MKRKTSFKKKDDENELRFQRIREQHKKMREKNRLNRIRQHHRREAQRISILDMADRLEDQGGHVNRSRLSEYISLGGRKKS